MNIGVPREIKSKENRVAVTPWGAAQLAASGHQVLVEAGAGAGSGILDEEYQRAGANIVSREEAWSPQLVCKVKEPLPDEFRFLRPATILFTYLHLADQLPLTVALIQSRCTAIAYETVQLADGRLPLLEPMSVVAGRFAIQVGARFLECHEGGCGVLLSGAPGIEPARVLVLGAGTVGSEAATLAARMGAQVTVLDINPDRLSQLDGIPNLKPRVSDRSTIRELLPQTHLLIGAVLTPGGRAPVLIKREDVKLMPLGSVIVDVAIDQGGCVETCHPATTHDKPTRIVEGVVHYSVGNMPGAVARTSTFALSNATLSYLLALADHGVDGAVSRKPELAGGINVRNGKVIHRAVAEALGEQAA